MPNQVAWWATSLFHSLRPYRSYLETVLLRDFYPYAGEFNVSLVGLWRRLLTATPRFAPLADAPNIALAASLLSAFVILAVCVQASNTPGDLGALLAFILWFCASLLLAPINGICNLAGLVLPFLVIARGLQTYPSTGLAVGTALATALIGVPQEWYRHWPALEVALERGFGLVLLVPPLLGLCGYVAVLAHRHRHHALKRGILEEVAIVPG